MLPSLFVGMVVYGVVIKFLLRLFPRLDEYQALSKEQKQEIWQDAIQKVDTNKFLKAAEEKQYLFLRRVTSNLLLDEKKLVVTHQFPFSFLLKPHDILLGSPA